MSFNYSKNLFIKKTEKNDIPDELLNSNSLSGIINKVIYNNEKNSFTILKLDVLNSEITAKGKILQPCEGMPVELNGFWITDKIYGLQFVFTESKKTEPTTEDAIVKYLGSGLIPNIGIKTAKKIVDFFGNNTLYIIENFPNKLIQIPGIGKNKASSIIRGYQSHKNIKEIMLFLASKQISTKFGYKLYSIYKNETISVLKKNPYVLIKDIRGIGFKKADAIANEIGITQNNPLRVINGCYYILNEAANAGHTFLPFQNLIEQVKQLLEVEADDIENCLNNSFLTEEYNIIKDESRLYLKWNFFSEFGIAELINIINKANNNLTRLSDIKLNQLIKFLEKKNKIELSDIQFEAIFNAIKNKIFILTGGPGTGKTTITKFIAQIFKLLEMKVTLCSPTGRAAKRLSELTDKKASTIHRLLEYSPQSGFQKNSENKISTDVLIIDEFSMVELTLFYNLLKALPKNIILIVIGDSNQLPSIGAGNLLADIINSEKIKVVTLNKIFRQAETSLIVKNAHNIINNKQIIINNSKTSNFFFMADNDKKNIIQTIVELFCNRLPAFGFSHKQIQILAPIYKGIIGVDNLNNKIQNELNKNNDLCFNYGNISYKVNDRIIQLKNNYNKNVMNGDIGIVIAVGKNSEQLISSGTQKNKVIIKDFISKNQNYESGNLMLVLFDDLLVSYTSIDADECNLAYAVTIHKSQGSEFDCVIMPISMDYFVNLNKNLIYTGITRAKKMCVIIGQKKALYYGITKNITEKRFSFLCERIKKLFN